MQNHMLNIKTVWKSNLVTQSFYKILLLKVLSFSDHGPIFAHILLAIIQNSRKYTFLYMTHDDYTRGPFY